jgi:glycosyltransferase involved in cell wall biosynthesis
MASYWPIEPDAHTAFWSDLNTASWKSLPKRLLAPLVRRVWLQSTPRNRLEFRRVLCVSAYLQEIMVHQAGIPRAQTRVVHNGIELELFSPRPGEVTDRPLRLLYAGRLSPDKGVDTVLESIAVLRRQNPELPVHLSLYGAGAPEYERRLRQAAQAAGITDRVAFAGLVPRIQMPRVLAAHDVLLFPSRWAEPLARIVQEAMACGLVVIGTATGGTPEILVDGHNGYIFPTDDAAALADKITRLAANRESWQRMAQAARQTVESRFSLKRMVDELIEEAEMLLTNVKAG